MSVDSTGQGCSGVFGVTFGELIKWWGIAEGLIPGDSSVPKVCILSSVSKKCGCGVLAALGFKFAAPFSSCLF